MDRVNAVRLDTTNADEVERVLSAAQPDLIINTVGLTNVDECESNRTLAQGLNADSAKIVARLAHREKISLVHISTDHLFDGTAPGNSETNITNPINNYAVTKKLGEIAVQDACPDSLIIRTNFYGWGTTTRPSFTDWILRSLAEEQRLTMFTDVFFTPILINHLVESIIDLVYHRASGVFNVVGSERISKYAFALKTADVFGYSAETIIPIKVEDFHFEAPRPQDMSLSVAKIEKYLGKLMPDVMAGLKTLKELGEQGTASELRTALVTPLTKNP